MPQRQEAVTRVEVTGYDKTAEDAGPLWTVRASVMEPIGLFGSRARSSERCDQFVARGTSGYTGSWGVLWAGGPASDEERERVCVCE